MGGIKLNASGPGATARRLGLPSEHDFWSRGISACAICDGAAPIFADVPLGVVGGGDSAVEEAVYLTKYSPKVRSFLVAVAAAAGAIALDFVVVVVVIVVVVVARRWRGAERSR